MGSGSGSVLMKLLDLDLYSKFGFVDPGEQKSFNFEKSDIKNLHRAFYTFVKKKGHIFLVQ